MAKRSSTGKYAMGCVIVNPQDNTIITNGWAHVPTMRNWKHYSLHAEMHALARGRHIDLYGSVAYVAAMSRKSGKFTTALPCLDCAIALLSAGVAIVYYTTPDTNVIGTLKAEAIPSMLSELKVYNTPNGS